VNELVSIVIPTYNVGSLVAHAVASVLEQTYSDVEVIVIDDGSTDGSADHLAAFDDDRLRVVRQENRGLSGARNAGFALSSGRYVAFLDADDLWFPTKLDETLPLLGDYVAVGSRMQYIGTTGKLAAAYAGQDPSQEQELIRAGQLMPFPISGTVFQRGVVEAAGPFDESLAQVEDLDFLLRVARLGEIGWTATPLGAYRLRSGSMSAAAFGEQRKWAQFVAARAHARDRGRDLRWEDFTATYSLTPKESRAELGAARYRLAGLLLANQDYRGIGVMLQAFATTPRYTITRLRRQLRRRA